MINTIVQIEGNKEGKEFFNAQFCPTEDEVFKAMTKFFDFFMENNTPKSDLKNIYEGCTNKKLPFNIEFDENNWLRMNFEKL